MRELTDIELQAVSGGLMQAPRPTEPPIVRIVLRVILEDVIRVLEGGRGMRPAAPKRPAAPQVA
jgi:hypothetical protein